MKCDNPTGIPSSWILENLGLVLACPTIFTGIRDLRVTYIYAKAFSKLRILYLRNSRPLSHLQSFSLHSLELQGAFNMRLNCFLSLWNVCFATMVHMGCSVNEICAQSGHDNQIRRNQYEVQHLKAGVIGS